MRQFVTFALQKLGVELVLIKKIIGDALITTLLFLSLFSQGLYRGPEIFLCG
jgi:hypothetical protein